jgi:hypothetical protein
MLQAEREAQLLQLLPAVQQPARCRRWWWLPLLLVLLLRLLLLLLHGGSVTALVLELEGCLTGSTQRRGALESDVIARARVCFV